MGKEPGRVNRERGKSEKERNSGAPVPAILSSAATARANKIRYEPATVYWRRVDV